MLIKTITLYNYRIYYGKNTIDFEFKPNRNLFIITGENGFGKTTFLHSLLWCLYGRHATDVDGENDKSKAQGSYAQLLESNLNAVARESLMSISEDTKKEIAKRGYHGKEDIKELSQYYVSIEFSEVMIPSIPCKSLTITRSFDAITSKENVDISIDGHTNELTRNIGPDIFINDFILSRDIARFFFFDSERIVSLADTNTRSEKQRLSSAYNEVLGVKKYEDLIKNLENLRLRLRRNSDDAANREKLEVLIKSGKNLRANADRLEKQSQELSATLSELRQKNDQYQVALMREGSSMSLEKYKSLVKQRNEANDKDKEYKLRLKDFLEEAPFAVSGKLFGTTRQQIEHDFRISLSSKNMKEQNETINDISVDLAAMVSGLRTDHATKEGLMTNIGIILEKYKGKQEQGDSLLNVSQEMWDDFMALYNNITSTYRSEFEKLADDYKKNKQLLERTSRSIANMQNQENDNVIKDIREKKNYIESIIAANEAKLRSVHEKIGVVNENLQKTTKEIQEVSRKVNLAASDVQKDNLAGSLIEELNTFLLSLREQKKGSLEKRIKLTLNTLMHKVDFVGHVEVVNSQDGMEVNLYSPKGVTIDKGDLSKGEQQLYAMSLLKALVDESGIQFPVFIDSPLQKFDKSHASKIIREYYPTISSQVILLPLLFKELNRDEVDAMDGILNESYIIKNEAGMSHIEKVDIKKLMN